MSEIIKPATPLPFEIEKNIGSGNSKLFNAKYKMIIARGLFREDAEYIKVSANLFPKLVELAVEYLECSSALPNFMEREEKIKELLKQCEVENGNS